jgi:hypothetical protein
MLVNNTEPSISRKSNQFEGITATFAYRDRGKQQME